MRRDIDKNVNFVEEPEAEIVHTPMGTVSKPVSKKETKPVKVGVHVKYEDKEYVVQSLKDDDQVFIAMGDEGLTVDKSEVEVI